MLLALLLHVLIFHLLTARDVPARSRKDTEYIIKHIDSCPDVGYYFRRESTPNSLHEGQCYLCFCQEDSTAVCWKRDNKRCNVESFHYHGVGKRNTRIRRSPGLADIFLRDSTRDFFNKNGKAECKPFESSFSNDCPPADWCTGCTVCDCDANGRWDCHILSFCPDGGKNKKKSKHNKGPFRKVVASKPVKQPQTSTNIPITTPKPVKKKSVSNKIKLRSTPPKILRQGNNTNKPKKRIFKKSVPVLPNLPGSQKRRTPIIYKRTPPSNKSGTAKKQIIKKTTSKRKPINIQPSKLNSEMEIAQTVMKTIMANLRHTVKTELNNLMAQQNKAGQQDTKNVKRNAGKSQSKPPPKKHVKKPTRKPPPKKGRNKRDVSMATNISSIVAQPGYDSTIVAQENTTESKGTSYYNVNNTAAVPITPVTSNLLIPNDNYSHTLDGISTPAENKYYKYVTGIEEPTMDGPIGDKKSTQVDITETVFNLLGTPNNRIVSTEKNFVHNDEAIITNLTEINPEENDLKYSKWSHLKFLKEIKSVSDKHKSIVKIINHPNKTINVFEDSKNKVHRKDVERDLGSRRFNIVKLIKPKCKVKRDKETNNTYIQMTSRKIGDLQNLLSNVLRELHKNNTTDVPPKKKFSILRYLKNFFYKVFKRKKARDQFSKHHLLETLCENFGPCKVSKKYKVLLYSKLADLDNETKKILKTVRIIKGLLKLIELPKSAEMESSKQENFQNDIQKFNNILKGTYATDKVTLSTTQLTQIEYIKKNTQDFIQSVSKFANLLNEIIGILTKSDTNISNRNSLIIRTNLISKNYTKEDPFQSFRNLLVKYNLIQNSFMKRMYEQLNNFENKINEKPKVGEVQEMNNSVAIDNFSRNIIQNLRKLKRLAQTVSYSGRTKREAMGDEDAIEYLLILIEYLIKQNHPLDAVPVNDGIDLLIQAIRNAPDIKPIKKKVLEYTPATYADSITTSYPKTITTESSISDDDSQSDNDKTNEDNDIVKLDDTEGNLKNKVEEPKDFNEMIGEDDKDHEDKYQYDRKVVPVRTENPFSRRAGKDNIDDITEIAFFKKNDDNIVSEPENVVETTTMMPLDMETNDKLDSPDDMNIDNLMPLKNYNLDKPLEESGVSAKKFEIFTADMDDETDVPGTTAIAELSSTVTEEYTNLAKKTRNKMRHLKLESADSDNIDKQFKLEWIEENFGKENDKEFTDFDENTNYTTQTVTVQPKTTILKSTEKIDISGLSKEVVDNEKNKNKVKSNAEEVMFKKQMDLLNSLDYGTEKTDLFDSDSKDGNTEDRYSYFV